MEVKEVITMKEKLIKFIHNLTNEECEVIISLIQAEKKEQP